MTCDLSPSPSGRKDLTARRVASTLLAGAFIPGQIERPGVRADRQDNCARCDLPAIGLDEKSFGQRPERTDPPALDLEPKAHEMRGETLYEGRSIHGHQTGIVLDAMGVGEQPSGDAHFIKEQGGDAEPPALYRRRATRGSCPNDN